MSDIMSYLFKTNAIKFCEGDKPFWYTSGKIGPYFINTHFVFGSEKEAADFLSFIDECLSDKISLPKKVFDKSLEQYKNNEIYRSVIDIMKLYIQDHIDISEIDYISGGERRDWFFSNVLAHLLEKPHITIYKDLSTFVSDPNFETTNPVSNLEGKKVLHIADLVTVASSYIRAWIPAIKNLGAKMCWSCVVVDRMQGGQAKLEAEGVIPLSLINVDPSLFNKALETNIIDEKQFELLNNFFKDPDTTMEKFVEDHPEFIENSLNSSDEKTRKRAKLFLEQNK